MGGNGAQQSDERSVRRLSGREGSSVDTPYSKAFPLFEQIPDLFVKCHITARLNVAKTDAFGLRWSY